MGFLESPTQRSVSGTLELIAKAPNNAVIIVDFDETLFLRNSTEEYLDSLKPRTIAAILLALLSLLKPWKWFGFADADLVRDWIRVVVVTLLFPWTPLVWRWRAKHLAGLYVNALLLESLAKVAPRVRVLVLSQGFDFIIRPLMQQIPLQVESIIACSFVSGANDRRKGKKVLLRKVMQEDVVARALLVTDSSDDAPLLSEVAVPCLVAWPQADYRAAMSGVYLPFAYLERAKHPGRKYLLKVILADDWLLLVLAATWLSPHPVFHAAAMLILTLSFWCIYESGYMENDHVAERFERKPVLSPRYERYKNRTSLWKPWVWAVALGSIGAVLLQWGTHVPTEREGFFFLNTLVSEVTLHYIVAWIFFLIIVRATFWAYNYVDKQARIWLYPFLQVYKCFGFLVVTSINVVGAMLFSAQVVSRWVLYIVYRFASADWPGAALGHLIRWFLFTLLVLAITLGSGDYSYVLNWQALVIFIWCAVRSRKAIWRVVRDVKLISRECQDL